MVLCTEAPSLLRIRSNANCSLSYGIALMNTTMNINEAIQQEQFENEWHKLRVNLLHSAGWLNYKIRDFIEPFGITQKQFNILRILRGQAAQDPGLTIYEIRSRMIDKSSDASRLVDRLVQKRLAGKRPCTLDKRHARVRISREGEALLRRIDKEMPRLDAATQSLSSEEAAALNALLDKMRKRDAE